ncbi:TPA: hypothetical protein JI393_RS14380 [Acinetobacter baumannii]|nr:hypothetical protein [Acinetobacter baumannii]HBI9064023.1 hypothetical protein [Acinetobacter baumannii]
MKNDSSAQALDLGLFNKNCEQAMRLLDMCVLRMDLAKTFALRAAISIDQHNLSEKDTVSMGTALKNILEDVVSKIDAAQKLTEVDLLNVRESIQGVMVCLRETIQHMTLNKPHTSNVFFLVDEAMEMFSAEVEALNEEIADSHARILGAYAQDRICTGGALKNSPAAANDGVVAA